MVYYESRLRLNCEDQKILRKKFRIYEKIGVTNLIIEPINVLKLDESSKNEICELTSIDLNFRINLKPKSKNNLKKALNKTEKTTDIVSIETTNKEIQIYGAKDSRIDIIAFSDISLMKSLTRGVISLTKQNNSFIEISLFEILERNKSLQSKNFREIFRSIDLVRSLNGNLIINGNFRDPCHFRHPRALISICHTLFGIPLVEAKNTFTRSVELVINRAINRQNKDFFGNGVKIIRGEN